MKLKARNTRISFSDHPARVVERNAEKLVADFDLFEQRMAEGRERMDIESGYTEQERLERMVFEVLGIGVNPVDPQREKVYEAEHNTHGDDDHYCEWTTFDQVAAFVREVEASAWWRSHFDNQPVPPLAIGRSSFTRHSGADPRSFTKWPTSPVTMPAAGKGSSPMDPSGAVASLTASTLMV